MTTEVLWRIKPAVLFSGGFQIELLLNLARIEQTAKINAGKRIIVYGTALKPYELLIRNG